jgi:hypothetical protein
MLPSCMPSQTTSMMPAVMSWSTCGFPRGWSHPSWTRHPVPVLSVLAIYHTAKTKFKHIFSGN